MIAWLPVPGYDGLYEVSDHGHVRGFKRQGSAGGSLVATAQPRGYRKICLYRNRRRTACWVHRLVLEAFVGPAPTGMIACHGNGDPGDNRLANLRWDTPSSNYEDARRHGTAAVGARNPMFRADDTVRATIMNMRSVGALQREIASAVGLSQQHVGALLREMTR